MELAAAYKKCRRAANRSRGSPERRICSRLSLAGSDAASERFALRGLGANNKPRLELAMDYRCEATSLIGFVQQLAANYLPHGYWHYVSGFIGEGKDPRLVDEKLLAKYDIALSRQTRARRKQHGFANLHYLRFDRAFVLLATAGQHSFYQAEVNNLRDIRHTPLRIGGYSISYKRGGVLRKKEPDEPVVADPKWHSRVQIERIRYAELVAYFEQLALRRSVDELSRELYCLPFEPYAPIRRQLLNLLRLINKRRGHAGLAEVPTTALRYHRRIVRPFEQVEAKKGELEQVLKNAR